MNNDQGVIYIATGERYVEMAAMSARSLKTHCPGLPVHIFTDCDTASYDCFDSSTKISDPNRKYGAKVDHFYETPYQRTLYLDADTRVCEDITPMFDLLDRYDIAMAHAPLGRNYKSLKKYIGQAPIIFSALNSGVILYKRTDPVIEFLKNWKKAFYEDGRESDQITLREQLWLTDLRLWILPQEYHCRPKSCIKFLKSLGITPKILHLRDFRKEAGFKPKPWSLRLREKINRLIPHKIQKPIRRLFCRKYEHL